MSGTVHERLMALCAARAAITATAVLVALAAPPASPPTDPATASGRDHHARA